MAIRFRNRNRPPRPRKQCDSSPLRWRTGRAPRVLLPPVTPNSLKNEEEERKKTINTLEEKPAMLKPSGNVTRDLTEGIEGGIDEVNQKVEGMCVCVHP